MTSRDGACFFEQLLAPPAMRKFQGRPVVSLGELMDPSVSCLDADESVLPLSVIEIQKLCGIAVHPPEGSDRLFVPAGRTWVMGHPWSSFVAQSFNVECVKRAGFGLDNFLTAESCIPSAAGPAVAVATDDVNAFVRMSASEAHAAATTPLDGLDTEWSRRGVAEKVEKRLDNALSGVCLGMQLEDGVRLQPKQGRLGRLLPAFADLRTRRWSSPTGMAAMTGLLQWCLMSCRHLLACLGKVYGFNGAPDIRVERRVPDSVLDEVHLGLIMFPATVVDLTRPFIMASDASPDFGFGVCRAPCPPSVARGAAQAAHDLLHEICPQPAEGDPEPRDRGLRPHWLPFGIGHFGVLRSTRARRQELSSSLEASAAVMAVRHLANRRRWHSHRVMLIVDAKAIMYAYRKGRSSAANVRFQCMQLAALVAASDIKLHLGYTSSERNPADWPSRGRR